MTLRQDQVAGISQKVGWELTTRTVLFHHAMAAQLGLSVTDLKCLDLLRQARTPLTPVNLAELTGMTGGAMTAVADHLERARFVERVHSRTDRRRWELRLLPERQQELDALFEPLTDATNELCRGYSDDELAVVLDFVTKLGPVMIEETERLRWKTRRRPPATTA
jgi:DNA-binding MarR family transcriptional regulator